MAEARQSPESLREHFTREAFRFGGMKRYHQDEARFLLGEHHEYHRMMAEKWALGEHLCMMAAFNVSDEFGIPEYGAAWDEYHAKEGDNGGN